MISFRERGSFKNLESYLGKASKIDVRQMLEGYGQEGVRALASATPVSSGLAAQSWRYEVRRFRGGWSIVWLNSDTENGFPVVIMLQYGHGTRGGGYVQGRDFINPAIKPVFDRISNDLGRVVSNP